MILTDVIIPARNEQTTIAPIVVLLVNHRKVGQVIVSIDADTTDDTAVIAKLSGATVITHNYRGKGQTVKAALSFVRTSNVLFCDADYRNLCRFHISKLLDFGRLEIQRIGVPDIPNNYPRDKAWAWPWVSGIRRVPTWVAREADLYGYLMEVQLNTLCQEVKIPTMTTRLTGLVSPYDMNEHRRAERERDRQYGLKMGILPNSRM